MCEWLCGSEWCDVRLQCGGRALPAHRAVLASVSGFLRRILLSNPTEEIPTLIVLPEFDLEAMSSVLYYIYNGEVIIQKHKLERFMEIVKAMQIFVDDRYLPSTCKSVEDCTSSAGINDKSLVKCKEFRLGGGPFVHLRKRRNIGDAYPKNVEDPDDNDKQIQCGWSNETCFRNEQLLFEDRQRSFVRDLFMETYPQNGNANGRKVAPGVLAMPSAHYRPPPSDPLSNANSKHLHYNTHVQMLKNPTNTPGFINYPQNLHYVQIPCDRVGNANSISCIQHAHLKNFTPSLPDNINYRNDGKNCLKSQLFNMVLKRHQSFTLGFQNLSERHLAEFLNCELVSNSNKDPFCHLTYPIQSNELQSNKTANSLSAPSTSTSPKGAILNQVLDSPWCPRQPTNYRPFRRKVQDPTDIPSTDGKEKAFNDDNNNIQTSSTPGEVDKLSANTIETTYIAPSLLIGIDFKCTICDQVFTDSEALTAHSRRHSTAAKYSCTECSKSFSQLRNFKYHMSIHRGTKEFAATCSVCGKYFNDRGYLSSHMKIHRNRKEYKCSQCPKSFNQRVAYNMHVRIHTGVKPHVCGECGKAFSRKMLLKQHQRTHSGERPYACSHCDKRFADRSNMTLHLRLHSGIKPFSCTLCPKSFTKKHHLKSHLNFHTGAKPYSCPKCKLAFTQSSNMRTHLKKCTAPDPSEIAESLNLVTSKTSVLKLREAQAR